MLAEHGDWADRILTYALTQPKDPKLAIVSAALAAAIDVFHEVDVGLDRDAKDATSRMETLRTAGIVDDLQSRFEAARKELRKTRRIYEDARMQADHASLRMQRAREDAEEDEYDVVTLADLEEELRSAQNGQQ